MKAHNAFTVRTFLKHDGDFKSCASALRAEGYGKGASGEDGHEAPPSQLDCCAEFAQRNSQTWAYDGVLDVWREWNNICWTHRLNDSTAYLALGQFIQSYGRKPVNSDGTLQSALKMLQRFMLRSFEEATGLINFTNGTLDLGCDGNWQIREHRRQDNLTSALKYAYVPGPHPSIDNFFLGSVPDPGGRAVIMTHIGLAILRDTRHRRALVLIGPPNSGKTIMLRLVLATCGQPPNSFAPAAIFLEGQEGDRKRASWGSDLMTAIDELPTAALRGEDLPKAMMAHSGVPMRQMYAADTRSNQWLAKITMTSNNDPQVRDQSRAMMSRLIFVDFPVSRREKRRDEEFDPAIHVDMKLWDRLVQEVPAFAVSCIRAGIEAQKSESYPISAAMEARANQIARDGDSIKSFVEECCFLDPEAFTHGDDLFSIYGTYCSSGDHQCSKKLGFRKGLLASFPAVRECKRRIAGRGENPLNGFSGIGVQADVLSYFPDRGIYSFKTA